MYVLLQSHYVCIKVIKPDSQLNYTFVQLTPEYKTTLNIKTSCGITVQRRVTYGNLMNIFIYKNHGGYKSFRASVVRQHKLGNCGYVSSVKNPINVHFYDLHK